MTKTKKNSVVNTTLENTVNVNEVGANNKIILDFTQDKPEGLVIAEAKKANGMTLNNNDLFWLEQNKVGFFTKVKTYIKTLFKK